MYFTLKKRQQSKEEFHTQLELYQTIIRSFSCHNNFVSQRRLFKKKVISRKTKNYLRSWRKDLFEGFTKKLNI